MPDAMFWDVDGTLAETERDGHLVAFNAAFEALHLPWRWSEQRYGELLRVAGGFERLLHDLATQPEAPRDEAGQRELAGRIHRLKNEHYAALAASGALPLRPGVRELFDDCATAGVRMAVVTTTSRNNVATLLHAHLGADWQRRFATLVCAEDAPRKKPDPQAYELALQRLDLPASATVAIEDSPAGLASATAMGIPVVICRSHYFPTDPMPGALAVGPGLDDGDGWSPTASADGRIDLAQIRLWQGMRKK
jgi:HAD superfamily hydrolase (TIGR01509 family)